MSQESQENRSAGVSYHLTKRLHVMDTAFVAVRDTSVFFFLYRFNITKPQVELWIICRLRLCCLIIKCSHEGIRTQPFSCCHFLLQAAALCCAAKRAAQPIHNANHYRLLSTILICCCKATPHYIALMVTVGRNLR